MNNTTENTNITFHKPNCLHMRYFFTNRDGYDILALQISYVLTSLMILIFNGILLLKFLKKKTKSRPDKLFIIMSTSDLGVGLFSVPLISIPLFIDVNTACLFSPYIHFFLFMPYVFSWTMVVIIALDRVFMITNGQTYGKYVTMKVLYGMIIFLFLKDIATALIVALDKDFLDGVNVIVQYTQFFVECFFILATIIAYIYLYYFFRKKSNIMANARHGGRNFDKKLLLTVLYTFICLIIFTIPQFAGVILQYLYKNIADVIFMRNILYWQFVVLFSNSYANALILLYNNRGKNYKGNKQSKTSISGNITQQNTHDK